MKLRIHHFLPASYANGPGCRAVLWVQGCPLHCPGCFNSDTHAFAQGRWVAVDELAREMITLGQRIQGLSISGGEPLAQAPALAELLRRVKRDTRLSILDPAGRHVHVGDVRGFESLRSLHLDYQ
jgi:anaerobic ribonucleoside-triphosphate reductase activating protein